MSDTEGRRHARTGMARAAVALFLSLPSATAFADGPSPARSGTHVPPQRSLPATRARLFRLPGGAPTHLPAEARPPGERRPVLIVFWASWCEPCLKEMPEISRLYLRYGDRVRFLGIAQELHNADNRRRLNQLVSEHRLRFPQYLEADAAPTAEQVFGRGNAALPAFALYDGAGTPLAGLQGTIAVAENMAWLTRALDAATGPAEPPARRGSDRAPTTAVDNARPGARSAP